jgi:hypothetical protein
VGRQQEQGVRFNVLEESAHCCLNVLQHIPKFPEAYLSFLLSKFGVFGTVRPSALPVQGMTIVGVEPDMGLTRGG